MKFKLLTFLMAVMAATTWMAAQTTPNITPLPKSMTVGEGTLTLPSAFSVSYMGLDDEAASEIRTFVDALKNATGLNVSATTGNGGLITVSKLAGDDTFAATGSPKGAYTLVVTQSGVSIQAANALGLFYAFQTLKKMLPANVMAGVREVGRTYALPVVNISDEPRFEYRGFMLDVCRHFFSVEEVKRMLDVMSYYKMNKFHWHLTEDQGWRAEIKKYPRLTTVGAVAPNARMTSMSEKKEYWLNRPYGPYFYTQEQMRDVVAYAKKLHIDVIPEVDMPGHFCAAMTAYPEFSCTPDGFHTVQQDGGVYSDILDVSNPKAMQFIYDVIDELSDIFPYEYFHIGGDECPTSAWENSVSCKALKEKLGLSNWRQLQSWFISKVDSCLKSKGKKASMWNESITASGADLQKIAATGAPIYCWTPSVASVNKAIELGLPAVYTPYEAPGTYYINRKQNPDDPPANGGGTDNLQATYNKSIPNNVDYGVQGTFWTERVSDSTYMEWLAMPRLMVIAEAGWTPQNRRSFDDFVARIEKDTTLLNYGNYYYSTYFFPSRSNTSDNYVMPKASTDSAKYYYRIISGGTDTYRNGKCIELLSESSPLLSETAPNGRTFASYNAQAGRLWICAPATEGAVNYDNQQWTLEEDPAAAGKYALVCKAAPNGSVNPTPTATDNSARWTYDNNKKNYSFILATAAYGKKGDNYYYSLTTPQAASGMYMNSAGPGQGYAVNLWSNVNDGNGGQWEFAPVGDFGWDDQPVATDSIRLEAGKLYTFTNCVEGFEGLRLVDDSIAGNLKTVRDPFAYNAWRVVSAVNNADGGQTVTLQNASTGRYISNTRTFVNKQGCPVSIGSTPASITLQPLDNSGTIRLLNNNKSLFPLPSGLIYAGGNASESTDAARGQGTDWVVQEVNVFSLNCRDDHGANLGVYTVSVPVDSDFSAGYAPVFKNMEATDYELTDALTYTVVYRRSAYSVIYRGTDTHGALVIEKEDTVQVGSTYKINVPKVKYYTLEETKEPDGLTIDPNGMILEPKADITFLCTYSTDAITAVKGVGDYVTVVEEGKYYLMYDATTDGNRAGYRMVRPSDNQINRSTSAEGLTLNAVWTLEGTSPRFRVKNVGSGLYVPQLVRSTAATASTTGAQFTFALNADGETWNIRGGNGQYWDGIESGALVGWDGGTGHPIRISTFWAQPMYTVTITCVNEVDSVLQSSVATVNAGEAFAITLPEIEGYDLLSTTGLETYSGTVEGYLNVRAVYSDPTGIHSATNRGASSSDSNIKSGTPIYDLQGRPVSAPARGIYIQGGKKRAY